MRKWLSIMDDKTIAALTLIERQILEKENELIDLKMQKKKILDEAKKTWKMKSSWRHEK